MEETQPAVIVTEGISFKDGNGQYKPADWNAELQGLQSKKDGMASYQASIDAQIAKIQEAYTLYPDKIPQEVIDAMGLTQE